MPARVAARADSASRRRGTIVLAEKGRGATSRRLSSETRPAPARRRLGGPRLLDAQSAHSPRLNNARAERRRLTLAGEQAPHAACHRPLQPTRATFAPIVEANVARVVVVRPP